MPNQKKLNMKTAKILVLGAIVTAFTFSSFAAEPLLSPRAAGNQIKTATSSMATATVTTAYVDSGAALLSPRAAANLVKVVKGTTADANPAVACQKTMNGTPKAVTECTSHTTMPACQPVTVAMVK